MKGYRLRKQSIKGIEIQTPEKKSKKRKKSKPSVSVSVSYFCAYTFTMNLSSISPFFPPNSKEHNTPTPLIVVLPLAIVAILVFIGINVYLCRHCHYRLNQLLADEIRAEQVQGLEMQPFGRVGPHLHPPTCYGFLRRNRVRIVPV